MDEKLRIDAAADKPIGQAESTGYPVGSIKSLKLIYKFYRLNSND